MSSTGCTIAVEDRFGPVVGNSCLGGFDFTLLFEESILTILPLASAGEFFFVRKILLPCVFKVFLVAV